MALAAVYIASGIAITYLLLPPPPEKPPALPELRIGGVAVPTTGDVLANAIDLVRRYANGTIQLKLPDGTTRALKRNDLGVEINRVRIADLVQEAQRPGSQLLVAHHAKHGDAPLDLPVSLAINRQAVLALLLDLKDELDVPATDAYVDLQDRTLKPEKVGYRLDVYSTLARVEIALRLGKDAVEVAAETIQPKLVSSRLGNVKFDHVLGYFETRYTQGERTAARTYNLRLAASKLDGVVVLPGEIFDFNEVVGPRDEAHGYRVATVIAQGELVDGLGGGTCQISGTLHGAAFFAGLEIVERYPHSRPSYYIKLGLDATVVYPTINYRFRNNFDFPIVLHETVAGGVVRAEILGPNRDLTVSYFRRIDEVLPFDEIERPTPKLPEGTRIIGQRGIPGFKTTSSRVVRDGAYAQREKWTDSYPPTTQIVHVGAGPKDLEAKAVDDNHPEYTVDEYLVITQGPDIRSSGATAPEPGGGTTESREPGRTGAKGYTDALVRFRGREGEGEDGPLLILTTRASAAADSEEQRDHAKGEPSDKDDADADHAGSDRAKSGRAKSDKDKEERAKEGRGKGGKGDADKKEGKGSKGSKGKDKKEGKDGKDSKKRKKDEKPS